MATIAVIDYGMGNLRSVVNALEVVCDGQQTVLLTDDHRQIRNADRVVFPGQGAARDCMRAIDEHDLRDTVSEAARNKPFLGICMGMQVLFDHSQENDGTDCLGLYAGEVTYFGDPLLDADGNRLKVPHMGWNRVEQHHDHALWKGIENGSRFYFVHSYYLKTEDDDLVSGVTDYGFPFASVIARENVFALQCHPEKSAAAGLRLLANFVNWDGHQ